MADLQSLSKAMGSRFLCRFILWDRDARDDYPCFLELVRPQVTVGNAV
jgi:hypothetical protein